MKIVATIVVGFVVIVAALFFVECSICAFQEARADRAITIFVAAGSFAAMVAGILLIAAIHKRPKEPHELL